MPDNLAAQQGLVLLALDEGTAVDHLVALLGRVPLPDLVHPDDPSVVPVRPGFAFTVGAAGGTQLRHSYFGGSPCAAWLAALLTGSRRRADTVALVALVDAQLLQTMMVSHRSPIVLAAGAASLAALGLMVQTPGVSQFFGSRPLGPGGWALGLGAGAVATLLSAAVVQATPFGASG